LEHKLGLEKKNRQELENKLIAILDMASQKEETNNSLFSGEDEKSNCTASSNLLETAVNAQSLLDLANEELKKKMILLEKVSIVVMIR